MGYGPITLGSLTLYVKQGQLSTEYIQGNYKQVIGDNVKVATIIGKNKIKRLVHKIYITGASADTNAATLEGYYDGSELAYDNGIDSFNIIITNLKKTIQRYDYYEYDLTVEEVNQ